MGKQHMGMLCKGFALFSGVVTPCIIAFVLDLNTIRHFKLENTLST